VTDLPAFLLARIAEEEADAFRAVPGYRPGDDDGGFAALHARRWTPARVLAECDAKGQLVELHPAGEHDCPGDDRGDDPGRCCPTLHLLALPYADHPDYRPEWRP
jgi:hypothetical protein